MKGSFGTATAEAASVIAIRESLAPPSGSENFCFLCAGTQGKEEAQAVAHKYWRTLVGKGVDVRLTTTKSHAPPSQFSTVQRERHRGRAQKVCRPGRDSPFPLNPKMESVFLKCKLPPRETFGDNAQCREKERDMRWPCWLLDSRQPGE